MRGRSAALTSRLQLLRQTEAVGRTRLQSPARCCVAGAARCRGRLLRWRGMSAGGHCRWSLRRHWAEPLHLSLLRRCQCRSGSVALPQMLASPQVAHMCLISARAHSAHKSTSSGSLSCGGPHHNSATTQARAHACSATVCDSITKAAAWLLAASCAVHGPSA